MIKQGKWKRYIWFDGKRYEFHLSRKDKRAAQSIADNLRAKGFNVRVFEAFGSGSLPWLIFKRKG